MPSQHQIDAFTQAFHLTAIQRLSLQPGLVERALQTVQRWQDQRGKSASDPYLKQWQILLSGDLQALKSAVCGDSDEAATLRNVSPLGFVLTPAERQALRSISAH